MTTSDYDIDDPYGLIGPPDPEAKRLFAALCRYAAGRDRIEADDRPAPSAGAEIIDLAAARARRR